MLEYVREDNLQRGIRGLKIVQELKTMRLEKVANITRTSSPYLEKGTAADCYSYIVFSVCPSYASCILPLTNFYHMKM